MEEVMNGILIREVETKNIMTKSSLPVGGYSVNPYVGCTHACKYCYASFMKRFTGHKEEWGTFLDVKHWPEIKNPKKYAGQRVVIGSVTDGYNPQEEQLGNTRKLLEQLIGSDADILICTKSDLVVRDIDLLKKLGRVTVSWSINTLDENFKNDMDSASSIERRISAMKQVYEAGIRTVCFVSPVFPGITDFEAIFEQINIPYHKIRLCADQNICITADELLQKLSGIPELLLLWIVAIRYRTDDHTLSGIFLRIFNFRPMLHIKESAPFLLVAGKALHKRSIAILAGMCTAYIRIDRVTAYRQTGLGHDVLCFHLMNENSIYYFFHDFCTSNTLLNSSGIS